MGFASVMALLAGLLTVSRIAGVSAMGPGMTSVPIWPLPETFECTGESKIPLIHSNITLSFAHDTPSPVAQDALARYEKLLRTVGTDNGRVSAMIVDVGSSDEGLNLDTDYAHSVALSQTAVMSTCP